MYVWEHDVVRRGIRLPGNGVTDSGEQSRGCWEPSTVLLREPITTEPWRLSSVSGTCLALIILTPGSVSVSPFEPHLLAPMVYSSGSPPS